MDGDKLVLDILHEIKAELKELRDDVNANKTALAKIYAVAFVVSGIVGGAISLLLKLITR